MTPRDLVDLNSQYLDHRGLTDWELGKAYLKAHEDARLGGLVYRAPDGYSYLVSEDDVDTLGEQLREYIEGENDQSPAELYSTWCSETECDNLRDL